MRYIFLLSGENPELAKEEVLSVIEGKEIYFSKEERILILETNLEKQNYKRLVMTHKIYEYLFESSFEDFYKKAENFEWNLNEDFYVSSYRIPRSNEKLKGVRRGLGRIIKEKTGLKVNPRNPKNWIEVIITPKKVYVGKVIFDFEKEKKELHKRDPKYRPVFSMITLKAKHARLLVNLSGAKEGEIILDPFCGVGSILIEAGLLSIKVIGIDLDDKKIEGARKNLEYYGIGDFALICGDAFEKMKEIGQVDYIVTDPPQGRMCPLKDIKEFYDKFLKIAFEVAKKGIVFLAPKILEFPYKEFDLDKRRKVVKIKF